MSRIPRYVSTSIAMAIWSLWASVPKSLLSSVDSGRLTIGLQKDGSISSATSTVSRPSIILGGGHGKLASGPVFLLDAYAEVLRAPGCAVSPFLERPPRVLEDGEWRTQSNPLSMLRLGYSFIVAAEFSLVTEG